MKKNILKLMVLAISSVAFVSCNNMAKMAELADQVTYTVVPEVLEVVAGQIVADVTVDFPADYFHPKAVLEVTPVLVYEGGEVACKPFIYQGSKVTENYKLVGEDGARINEQVAIDYIPGMEKSHLELRGVVQYKSQDYEWPQAYKIADGANTTYMLVKQGGSYAPMADKYQEVIPETAEAQILYLINSSDVRNKEIKSADVKAYTEALKALENDERRAVVGTDIVSYASPDGPDNLNSKLSDKRSNAAEKAFKQVTKKLNTGDVTTKSIGEDWNGFQELVEASDIEDKDLIIRVLSMYSDPNVREREIKNMSGVYKDLANDVLPQLRRSRFITNVEFTNYTAEELTALVESNIDVLDEEALLRAATLVKDNDKKIAIYKQAIDKYNSQRAIFNTACVYLDENKNDKAAKTLESMAVENCCVKNAKAVIAIREGRLVDAAELLKDSNCEDSKSNLAVIDILNGKYDDAVAKLAGTGDENEALAYILTNQLDKASAAIKCDCPRSAYLKAIVAARQGKVSEAKAQIENASKKSALADRAEKDVEFAKVK